MDVLEKPFAERIALIRAGKGFAHRRKGSGIVFGPLFLLFAARKTEIGIVRDHSKPSRAHARARAVPLQCNGSTLRRRRA